MKNQDKNYKGREWSCDDTHTGHLGGGCFTCESIRTGVDHRIEMGIEAEFFGNTTEDK